MAELVFFTGTMDSGKSTLALQLDHTRRSRGRSGILLTRLDRTGPATVSSRLGLRAPAVEVTDDTDVLGEVTRRRAAGERIEHVIADEAQFFAPGQIDGLARIVDELDVDVFAFGIATDFRARLFPGSARLVELADRVQTMQAEALCWCGRRAVLNARTLDGVMTVEGEQVVPGDVTSSPPAGADVVHGNDDGSSAASGGSADAGGPAANGGGAAAGTTADVGYETLCRRHWMQRRTARTR